MKRITWFIFILILTISCLDEPDCFRLSNNKIGVRFRWFAVNSAGTVITIADTTRIDSIAASVKDVGIINTSTSEATLLLNPQAEQVDYQFGRGGIFNNLGVGYKTAAQFVSTECGTRYIYSDLKILEHNFDSARVVSAAPNYANGVNIDVYRCHQNSEVGILFRNSAQESIDTAYYPLDLANDSTLIVLGTESLTLAYARRTTRLGAACGIKTFVYNLTITSLSERLDTLAGPVKNRIVSDPRSINLEIIR